jgi:hypothetical protein
VFVAVNADKNLLLLLRADVFVVRFDSRAFLCLQLFALLFRCVFLAIRCSDGPVSVESLNQSLGLVDSTRSVIEQATLQF